MSANASLIAGIGTLVLAIGVGVLIGRTGDGSASTAASAAPQIIKVGGGAETTTTANTKEASGGKSTGGSNKAGGDKVETDSSGTSKAAAEVLKPSGDVKLPPPTTQPGEKCESGTAGCENGEFNGSFFGE